MLDLKARFLLAVNLAIIGGMLLFIRTVLNTKSDLSYKINFILMDISIFTLILLVSGLIIIWNILIIYKLIYDVINPRNNPFQQILNVDEKYKQSPFFPVPENDCFDFAQVKKQIENYNEDDIENIYIVELLKVSYIRYQKLTNLNKIIYNYFKRLLIFLGIFIFAFFVIIGFLKF